MFSKYQTTPVKVSSYHLNWQFHIVYILVCKKYQTACVQFVSDIRTLCVQFVSDIHICIRVNF